MRITTVLFDIDGTLVDSNDAHVAAWSTAFRAAGHDISPAAIHEQMGKGADNLVPALLPGGDAEALGTAHGEVFKRGHLATVRPFTDAAALLARVLEAGKTVVLASSASAEEVKHYVGLLRAHDLVTATTSSDDVAHTKPAPDIFKAALDKVGIAATAAIVVGDTPYDVEAAARCGVAAIALLSGGFAESVLREAGAVAIYNDVAALLAGFEGSPLAG